MVVPFYLQIPGPRMGVRCEGGVFKGALRAYLADNETHSGGGGQGRKKSKKSESDATMHPLFPMTHILSHI